MYLVVSIPQLGLNIVWSAFLLIPPNHVLLPFCCNIACPSSLKIYDCKSEKICFLLSSPLSIYAKGESDIETPSTGYIAYKVSLPCFSSCLFIFIIEDSYVTTA